jgi:pimeloyl-ACP methyl ester carboxylesterase
MKALNSFGFPVLRFNFRGAGLSEDHHDEGRGEVEDVRAALQWLESQFDFPIILAGFSFGAAAGLRAACPDPRVTALISLGTPVRVDGRSYGYKFLIECTKPKLFISGAQDQYGPRHELELVVARAPEPKTGDHGRRGPFLHWASGGDAACDRGVAAGASCEFRVVSQRNGMAAAGSEPPQQAKYGLAGDPAQTPAKRRHLKLETGNGKLFQCLSDRRRAVRPNGTAARASCDWRPGRFSRMRWRRAPSRRRLPGM